MNHRDNPHFVMVVSTQDWRALYGKKHPGCKRNELFLCNVTKREFEHLRTVYMLDFKKVRLGNTPVDEIYFPMFGKLRRSAVLKRRSKKNEVQK